MNLKFENFEFRFLELDIEIINFNFINMRFGI